MWVTRKNHITYSIALCATSWFLPFFSPLITSPLRKKKGPPPVTREKASLQQWNSSEHTARRCVLIPVPRVLFTLSGPLFFIHKIGQEFLNHRGGTRTEGDLVFENTECWLLLSHCVSAPIFPSSPLYFLMLGRSCFTQQFSFANRLCLSGMPQEAGRLEEGRETFSFVCLLFYQHCASNILHFGSCCWFQQCRWF